MKKFIKCIRRLVLLGSAACFMLAWTAHADTKEVFDHGKTGFELSGGHKFAACERCHVNGQFKGTPTNCVSCHSISGRFNITTKPINHLNTSTRCESCHNVAVWNAVAKVDHAEVFGACVNCHNFNIGPSKPAMHIPVGNQCSDCHSDMSWLPVNFTHDGVVTACVSCHDNAHPIQAGVVKGKPLNHRNTTNNCAGCHQTKAFAPVLKVDHAEVIGTCESCHGIGAPDEPKDKPMDMGRIKHSLFGTSCGNCHQVTGFKGVILNHSNISGLADNCAACHEQDRSQCDFHRRPPFVSNDCSGCHRDNTMTFQFSGGGTCANGVKPTL